MGMKCDILDWRLVKRGLKLEHSDFLCFRLAALSRKMNRFYSSKLGEYGVTIQQTWVLFQLFDRQEGCSQKEIAAAIQLDSPVVTGLINRLIKLGLVVRKQDPSDRRSIRICITTTGSKLIEEAYPIAVEYNQYIRSIILAEDLAAFDRTLSNLEIGL